MTMTATKYIPKSDIIGFSFLSDLFQFCYRDGREVMHPLAPEPMRGKRMERETLITFGGIKADALEKVESELKDNEPRYFSYLASCTKEAWPIILKRYTDEASFFYNQALYYTRLDADTRQGWLIEESPETDKKALEICSAALSVICDLIEDFCPESKEKLLAEMPQRFMGIDDHYKDDWAEYEILLNEKTDFPDFREAVIQSGFIDYTGKWLLISDREKPSAALYYGSLCYFVKKVLVHFGLIKDMNERIFKWNSCKSLFPDLQEKDSKFLSSKLDGFRNSVPTSQRKYKEKIDTFFASYIPLRVKHI